MMTNKEKRTNSFLATQGTVIDRLIQSWRFYKVRKVMRAANGLVCDLGCGMNGEFLKSIENEIAGGVGVDIKVGFVKSSKINLIEADLNSSLPIGSGFFDAVFSLAVVEHLDDYETYFNESFRILRSGGRVIMTTPHPRSKSILELLSFLRIIDRREIGDHKNYFTTKNLEDILRKTGFSKIRKDSFQFGLNNLIIAQK